MELNDIYPSKYLKAADLKGRVVTVCIAKADIETIGQDRKLVIYFQNKEKGLVTNKTNATRIAYLYGNNTDGWIGKEIGLGSEMVDYQGKTTEAIRVRPPERREQPQQQAAQGNYQITRSPASGAQIMEHTRGAGVAPQADADLNDPIPF